MYSKFIDYLKEKPSLYAPSSAPFWDDEHISEYMLKAHLDPEIDAASRRHDFIEQSAKWIAQYCKARSLCGEILQRGLPGHRAGLFQAFHQVCQGTRGGRDASDRISL